MKNNILRIIAIAMILVMVVALGSSCMNANYDSDSNGGKKNSNVKKSSVLKSPASYEELLEIISNISNRNNSNDNDFADEKGNPVSTSAAMTESTQAETTKPSNSQNNDESEAGKDPNASESNFSDTKTQVAGVMEGDIIKTDGKYFYILSGKGLVRIVKADKENTTVVSTIQLPMSNGTTSYNQLIELYVYNGTLTVIMQENTNWYYNICADSMNGNDMFYYFNYTSNTVQINYDVKDPTNPVYISTLMQEGDYISSRMIGQYLYVISLKNAFNYNENAPEPQIPSYYKEGERSRIPLSDIALTENPTSTQFLIVTGVDNANAKNFASQKATLGGYGAVYANVDNLYVSFGSYNMNIFDIPQNVVDGEVAMEDMTYIYKTDIIKYNLNKGEIEIVAVGSVDGSVISQFYMNEFNGTFSVVTNVNEYSYRYNEYNYISDYTDENAPIFRTGYYWSTFDWKVYAKVTTFDKDLKKLGEISDLGVGETLRSCRFDGNLVYFVTFLQTDPLFAVDLTNAQEPKLLSELKIPGYSTYLEKYAENLLLGFGFDSDENGFVNGLKFSMFDVSDPNNVIEISKLVLSYNENGHIYSEAIYNYKALLTSEGKNIIAVPINGFSHNLVYDNYYLVLSYTNDEFVIEGKLEFVSSNYNESARGIYIDNYLYLVSQDGGVAVYNLDDLSAPGIMIEFDNYTVPSDVTEIKPGYPKNSPNVETTAPDYFEDGATEPVPQN